MIKKTKNKVQFFIFCLFFLFVFCFFLVDPSFGLGIRLVIHSLEPITTSAAACFSPGAETGWVGGLVVARLGLWTVRCIAGSVAG